MNFFEAQDRTRRNTRWLIVIFALATLAITAAVTAVVELTIYGAGMTDQISRPVWFSDPLRAALIAAGVLGFILLASAYRVAQLRGGGERVAQEMGGTEVTADVDDRLRQRLRHVVEEMAIASGVPVPQIFVLESESGINAFAAGFSPADAAVAVTRGALEQLNRDELQGVIAHEFSHILNGDMRLNVRLMGILFGIISIGQIGRLILRSGRIGRVSVSRNNRGSSGSALVLIGLALFILGAIGVFVARLIRASVSRQREYLADASAVQFTRQTAGIAGALAKIAGISEGSRLTEVDPEQVSHMLIANGARQAWLNAFASHPPIEDRINALDANVLRNLPERARANVGASRPTLTDTPSAAMVSALNASEGRIAGEHLTASERIGHPADSEIAMAAAIRLSLPTELTEAAHSREWSLYLALALAMAGEPADQSAQLAMLGNKIGASRCERIQRYLNALAPLGPRFRLPLLELAFPALKQRPAGQLQYLMTLVDELQGLRDRLSLRDILFRSTLAASLEASLNPGRRAHARRTHLDRAPTRRAAAQLIALLAQHGHQHDSSAQSAYETGVAMLEFGVTPPFDPPALTSALDILEHLRGLIGRDQERLLKALVTTISHDGYINVAESEFMRLTSIALDCPLPPVVDDALEQALPTGNGGT